MIYTNSWRSYSWFDWISYLLSLIMAWVNLLADCDESLQRLHPSPWHFFIKNVWDFWGVSSYSYAEHCNAHWPRSISNWQVYVLIVCLNVLSHKATIHDVVDWPDHIFVSSTVLKNMKQTLHIRWGLLVSYPIFMVLLAKLFSVVFLLKCLVPISQNFVDP